MERQRKPEHRRDYKREMQKRAEQLEESQPGDEQEGGWQRLELETMNERFRRAFIRSIKEGQ